jgi:hypothetical protein
VALDRRLLIALLGAVLLLGAAAAPGLARRSPGPVEKAQLRRVATAFWLQHRGGRPVIVDRVFVSTVSPQFAGLRVGDGHQGFVVAFRRQRGRWRAVSTDVCSMRPYRVARDLFLDWVRQGAAGCPTDTFDGPPYTGTAAPARPYGVTISWGELAPDSRLARLSAVPLVVDSPRL